MAFGCRVNSSEVTSCSWTPLKAEGDPDAANDLDSNVAHFWTLFCSDLTLHLVHL